MQLKIGEVARRTGLSIRTLRHYDALGLLRPTGRSQAAYRLYSPADLTRLLHIQSLKSLGLSLAEIAQALDDPTYDARSVLRQHIASLERRILQEQTLLDRLRALQGVAKVGWTEVAEVIQLSERVEKRVKQFMYVAQEVAEKLKLNDEQRAHLQDRPAQPVGEDWPRLLTDIFTALERRTPPPSPDAQKLARRWNALVQDSTGGRADIAHALGSAYRQHLPPELHTVWAFIADAVQHLSAGAPMTTPNNTQLADLGHPDKNVRIRAALDVGAARQQDALPELLRRLTREADFFVRENLTWAVARMGEAALPGLLKLLEHPDAAARLQAVHTLSKIADPRATAALLNVLNDADAEVARKAIFALGQLGSPQALSTLIAGLGDVDAERRTTLSTAIQGFGAAALAPLGDALPGARAGVRAHAADILGLLGDPAAVPALAGAFTDDDWNVRFAVLSALGHLPGAEADAAIERAAQDTDARLRAVALRLQTDRQRARAPSTKTSRRGPDAAT